jgi:hypothetical protein
VRSTLTGLTLASLLLLGCSREPSGLAAEHQAARTQPQSGEARPESGAPATTAELGQLATQPSDPTLEQAAAPSTPEPDAQTEGDTEASLAPAPGEAPADPLAPVLPSAPEPGTPEADAELAELLEESKITQEEFDRAFRGSGPKIEGDQFVFDRARARPEVRVGQPRVGEGSLDPAAAKALAEAELREFVGCYAMALAETPGLEGSVVLRLRFGADARVASTSLEGGAKLGSSLRDCLGSVPANWSLPGAAGATVELPLSLSATAQ